MNLMLHAINVFLKKKMHRPIYASTCYLYLYLNTRYLYSYLYLLWHYLYLSDVIPVASLCDLVLDFLFIFVVYRYESVCHHCARLEIFGTVHTITAQLLFARNAITVF